jgi:GTP cyclohydrolase I
MPKISKASQDAIAAGQQAIDEFEEANPEVFQGLGPSRTSILRMQTILQATFSWAEDESYKTAQRFLRYLHEFNKPFKVEDILGDLFDGAKVENIGGLILQRRIPFRMICEHHLLPAVGHAWVGYIPRKKVVGLSKIARLVQAVGTSRPGMQELFCEEITDALHDYTDANGTITVINSLHTCMACRGIYTPETSTSTSCVRGVFRDVASARQEFFSLAGISGNI